ncbi:MAG: C1 family peptidase [Fimbriimonas sp.]|nr:C1 family peptidase [Fimbriimonas sp.]
MTTNAALGPETTICRTSTWARILTCVTIAIVWGHSGGYTGDQHSIGSNYWKAYRTSRPLLAEAASSGQKPPASADLRSNFDRFGMDVCSQDGPWCWAYTTLGVLEYEAAARLGQRGNLSAGYLAWAAQATDRQGSGGSNFGRADRALESFGAVPFKVGGDPPSGGSLANPPTRAIAIGQLFGGIEFHWIRFWNRGPLTEKQMLDIKLEIAGGHPVAVGMLWPNRTEFMPGSTLLKLPEPGDVSDGHCVVLVGYRDDTAFPGGGAFLFRNSWGKSWGDNGYAWMPYRLLSECINDAYAISDVSAESPAPLNESESAFAEDLELGSVKNGTLERQDMSPFGAAWGGRRQLYFQAREKGASFVVNTTVRKSGRYRVRIAITRAENYGRFSVVLPDGSKSSIIHGEGPGVSLSQPIDLGVHDLSKGTHPIRFVVEGASVAGNGMGLGLHCIELSAIP